MHGSTLLAHEDGAVEAPCNGYSILSAGPAHHTIITIKGQCLNVSAQSKVDLDVIVQRTSGTLRQGTAFPTLDALHLIFGDHHPLQAVGAERVETVEHSGIAVWLLACTAAMKFIRRMPILI